MSSRVRENLLNQRKWYARQVGRPWVEGDLIKIVIRGETLDRTLSEADYYDLLALPGTLWETSIPVKASAVLKIYDFYGKELPLAAAAPSPMPSATGEAYHFFTRPMTRPLLLFSIEKSVVDGAPKKIDTAASSIYVEEYRTSKFDRQVADISTMFNGFQSQSKYFEGSTKPSVNFIQDYNKLLAAVKKIKLFIEFNDFKYRPYEDDKIRIAFDSSYQITNITLVQRGLDKPLIKGKTYFLYDTPGLKDPRVNRLLFQLHKIHRLKTSRQIPTWSEFIAKFLPNVEVNFFGRPHSPTEENEQKKGQKPFIDKETEEENKKKLKDPVVQLAMLRQAMEKDPERKKMEKKLQKVAEKMKDAEAKVEIVQEFINKYGIDNLIMAALECLAIKSGWTLRTLPPIPGLNPYDIMPKPLILKIPKIEIDLPTVDIAKGIVEEIKQGLIDAAYDALLAVTQTLADIIVELCRGQDEEEVGEAIPINSLIDLYPQPTRIAKDEPNIQACLESCYEEFNIVSETGDSFLAKVAQNITPRETCDLINGAASERVVEVIKNILSTEPDFLEGGNTSLSAILFNDARIVDFFICVGGCVSNDYCESVYAEPPINVDDLDPCTIEEMLTEAVDPSIFDALLDAYDNGAGLMDGAIPDLGCGAGVVPAFASMPALNHSITTMFTGLFDIPKTAFIRDISLLRDILLVPTPGCSTENAALMDALEEAGALPTPPSPRDDEGALTESDRDPPGEQLMSLFPSRLMSNPQIAGIARLFEATDSGRGSACAGISITYNVAPGYKDNLAGLDRNISSPWLSNNSSVSLNPLPDYNNMYFSILIIDYNNPELSSYIYFSPGQVPAGSAASLFPLTYTTETGIERYPVPAEGASATYQCADGGDNFQFSCDGREFLASAFESSVFDHYISTFELYNPPIGPGSTGFEQDPTLLRQACKKSLYFSAYISLFNSLAYNVRNSKLFSVGELKKLSLVPIPCPNGATFGNDLLDIDGIIQEALNEFEENSCTDKTCVIGPVEDALIYAVLNAYVQVLLLEQLLKNIFLLDAYGLDADWLSGEFVRTNIIEAIYGSIGATSTMPLDANEGREDRLERQMLIALTKASIMHVDKLRIRAQSSAHELDPGRHLPNPTDPDGAPEIIPLDVMAAIDAAGPREEAVDLTTVMLNDTYGKYALEYVIRKRLVKMADIINTAFGKQTAGADTSFLLYGLPTSDVLDFPLTVNPSAPIKPQLKRASGWGDIFTWELEEPEITTTDQQGVETITAAREVDYNYGTSLRYPGVMSDTISEDEALLAANHGVFVRENYIKLAVNMDNLNNMLAGTPIAGSVEADNAVKAAMMAEENLRRAGQIKEWMDKLLPIPFDASTQEGEYTYASNWNDMVVSIDRFNTFVNTVRASDTKPDTSLDSVSVMYIVRTIQHESPWYYWKGRAGNGSYDHRHAGDKKGINLGLGCETANCGKPGHAEKVAGREYYHAVRGPIRKNNYDAIRFWWNEVRQPDSAQANLQDDIAGRGPGTYMDRSGWYGGDHQDPTTIPAGGVDVAFEGDLFEEGGSSFRRKVIKHLGLPSVWSWTRQTGHTAGGVGLGFQHSQTSLSVEATTPLIYPFVANGTMDDPWDLDQQPGGSMTPGGNAHLTEAARTGGWAASRYMYRKDWISDQIVESSNRYDDLHNRITVYWWKVDKPRTGPGYGEAEAPARNTITSLGTGDIQYRLRKNDLYPSDYNEAVWTGYPTWTLLGYGRRWHDGIGSGNDLGPAGVDWPAVQEGDADGDGYADWAVRFFQYPSMINELNEPHEDWAQYTGNGGISGDVDYAVTEIDRRVEVASTYLPDKLLQAKLQLGYANNTIAPPHRWGWDKVFWNASDYPSTPSSGHDDEQRHHPAYKGRRTPHGDISVPFKWHKSPGSQLRCQDPRVGPGPSDPSKCPSLPGLASGDFEVVDIWLVSQDGERQVAMEEQIRDMKWDEFQAMLGNSTGTSNDPGPAPGAQQLQAMTEAQMFRALMEAAADLLGPDFSPDEARWPSSTGYLTGDKSYDNTITHVLKDIRMGSRIAYYSPKMSLEHPVMRELVAATVAPGTPVQQEVPECLSSATIDQYIGLGVDLALLAGRGCPGTEYAPPDTPPPQPVNNKYRQHYYKTKSNWIIQSADPGATNTGRIWGVDTGIKGEVSLAGTVGSLDISARSRDIQRRGGAQESKYVDTRMYDVVRPFLRDTRTQLSYGTQVANQIVNDEGYKKLFKNPGYQMPSPAYDSDALMQFLFTIGLRSADMLSGDFTTMFNDTKISLRMILRAALAGDDYAFTDPESRASSDALADAMLGIGAAFGEPFAEMGQSFILKMLIETPIRILKGLAEMIDPHVVVGKIIKDVSGQIIEQASRVTDLAQAGGAVAAALAEQEAAAEEIAEFDLVEFMDNRIAEKFGNAPKFIRPSVSPDGLNLIGTIPYIFALPPGPLGIIYILLRLFEGYPPEGEFNPALVDAVQQCPSLPAPAPPQLGPPPEPREPSSTYSCEEEPDRIEAEIDDVSDTTDGGGGLDPIDCT